VFSELEMPNEQDRCQRHQSTDRPFAEVFDITAASVGISPANRSLQSRDIAASSNIYWRNDRAVGWWLHCRFRASQATNPDGSTKTIGTEKPS
jgi:hypothetical protein